MQYWPPGSYIRDYLGIMFISAVSSVFLFFSSWAYLYTTARLDGEGAVHMLFGCVHSFFCTVEEVSLAENLGGSLNTLPTGLQHH